VVTCALFWLRQRGKLIAILLTDFFFLEGFRIFSCESVIDAVCRGTLLYFLRCKGQAISVTTPELFVLTHMAEDTPNPQPSQNSQNQSTRRDAPRHHGNHRRNTYRQPVPRPAEKPAEKPQELKELNPDDDETEQDRSSAPSRHSRGGGRGKPPKRIIEEWASDIYCE
jgi:hypothetical protein